MDDEPTSHGAWDRGEREANDIKHYSHPNCGAILSASHGDTTGPYKG